MKTCLALAFLLSLPLFGQGGFGGGYTPPNAGGSGSGTVTSVATSNGLTGGTITTTGTISGVDAVADGATKGVSTFTTADFNATAGVISLDYTNGQKATGSVPGFLSAADWTTFNGKGSGTVTSIATTSPIGGGTITGTGTLTCATCVVASSPGVGLAHFAGSTQTVTSSAVVGADMTANTVTSTQLAVVNTRHVCDMAVGDTTAAVITNAQLGPQSRICYIPYAATIVELDVNADAGTPNVIVGVNHAGSISNIVSSALATAASGGIACSKTSGVTGINGATTCSATLQNTSIAAGDYLELVSGTAGGTAKFFVAHVIYTIN